MKLLLLITFPSEFEGQGNSYHVYAEIFPRLIKICLIVYCNKNEDLSDERARIITCAMTSSIYM